MTDFTIKQNDTSPSISAILKGADREVIDLSGATVRFNMKNRRTGELIVDGRECTVIDATAGQVRHDWQAGDTATSGLFNAEFEITFSSGKIESVPNGSHIQIKITAEIG